MAQRGTILDLRVALEQHGLLMAHDAALPSATTLVAGEPIQGSWWGHGAASDIFEALTELEHEVLRVKLVREKVTLVHRSLWGAVHAVGAARSRWQTAGLDAPTIQMLQRTDGGVVRTPDLDNSERRAAMLLEKRLLVYAADVHTESGKHVRVFESWPTLSQRLLASEPPGDEAVGRARLEDAVRSWDGELEPNSILPW